MSVPVCKFYSLNQSCRFGRHCKFLHSTAQRPPPYSKLKDENEDLLNYPSHSFTALAVSDNQKELNTNQDEALLNTEFVSQQCEGQIFARSSNTEENAVQTVEEGLSRGFKKQSCYYFNKYGSCRFGDGCRYSHTASRTSHGYDESDQERYGGSRRPGDDGADRQRYDGAYRQRYDGLNHQRYDRPDRQENDTEDRQKRQTKHKADIPPRFRKPGDERVELATASSNFTVSNDTKPRRVINETNFVKREDNLRYNIKRNIHFERRVCPFFKSGRCNRGDNCRFIHASGQSSMETSNLPSDLTQSENEIGQIEKGGDTTTRKEGVQAEKPQDGPSYRPVNKPVERPHGLKQIFTYAELDEIGVRKVRDSEISTIKKRFPHDKLTILEETDSKFSVQILFSPTDPEWPFDVRVFELKFTVPQDYPKQMMSVELPVEQNLPETVRRYVEVSIKEWLDHKEQQLSLAGKVELVFRPFLRWLDRSIEDITTEALKQLKRELVAKAAGMEFLSAQKLQEKFRANEEKSAEEEDDNNMNSSSESTSADETTTEGSADDSDENDDGARLQSVNLDPEKKGTEVELRHLQLREKASALMFEKIKLVLQCGRCKHHSDLLVAQNKVMSVRCEKCNQNQFVHFRPALVHQFSSVIGYLDLDGCQAFDLIFQDCRVSVTCMNCGKLTRMDGLVSGQMVDGWCQACNARFKLATEAVKFSQLVPSAVNTSSQKVVEVASSKQKKPPKDPAIKEGSPLPEFGTCKHFKHSYRWLRFPCCGKAYPCDVCHDKKEEHEMVRAIRMICGHCCKEQNFSATRPCSACGQHLTKIKTAHWEGGSGCRDRITMSKNDQQKYKNMSKTLSNHLKKVQAANSGKKKKTTTLRHS